ncbi:MAG: L-2-amino-thiazoline-4-carboxylic acid hydrolase, partial [Burkholderiaceae bacterium]
QGYDPNITLERRQTIMQGASCCTFRYRYDAPQQVKPPAQS